MEHVTAEVITGAGHMLPVAQPARFTDRLLAFLDGVEAGGTDHAS